MVEHPLSERVAWRAVWRLLLALSALLLAGWSVGGSDRNPWTPPAAAGESARPALPLVSAAGHALSPDARAAASRPAVWTSVVAGTAHAEAGDRRMTITAAAAAGEMSPPLRPGERRGARVAEFDGVSIVLAVLALLALVSWRRRDQVLR